MLPYLDEDQLAAAMGVLGMNLIVDSDKARGRGQPNAFGVKARTMKKFHGSPLVNKRMMFSHCFSQAVKVYSEGNRMAMTRYKTCLTSHLIIPDYYDLSFSEHDGEVRIPGDGCRENGTGTGRIRQPHWSFGDRPIVRRQVLQYQELTRIDQVCVLF